MSLRYRLRVVMTVLTTLIGIFGSRSPVSAQEGEIPEQEVTSQIWANITYGRKYSEKLYLQASVEGKSQTSGSQTWRSLSVTPAVDYYPNHWLDLIGELNLSGTRQFDGAESYEVTPRIGIKLHFLKQALGYYASVGTGIGGPLDQLARTSLERASLSRWDFAILLRVEARNIWYSPGNEFDYSTRARTRLEYKLALNRDSLAADKVVYLLADIEYFEPFGDDVIERFPSKTRARLGIGYRLMKHHRVEVRYIRDFTRDTPGGQDTLGAEALSLNWKMKY